MDLVDPSEIENLISFKKVILTDNINLGDEISPKKIYELEENEKNESELIRRKARALCA